eukprot:CAMPEP_0195070330 /NCGR_PEP_ID=MMETSP0448-20130528/14416_1 /TAXON_ID=66468 /ORGANISM="Heterocapsa triquestra, Strain CCMP 448" /LENGTH=109 /DNA_ID=CAMNT_0040102027 /DNA_START=171 /DNA_END=498 /DNA_ORIENTATION=+
MPQGAFTLMRCTEKRGKSANLRAGQSLWPASKPVCQFSHPAQPSSPITQSHQHSGVMHLGANKCLHWQWPSFVSGQQSPAYRKTAWDRNAHVAEREAVQGSGLDADRIP